jgi:hypothetical protein
MAICSSCGTHLSGNWEISRRDLHNPQFIPVIATGREFLDTDFEEYSTPTSRSLICCRVVAIIVISLSLSLSLSLSCAAMQVT